MIEEKAIVTRTDDDAVWVRALGPETCPRCAEGRGCGGGVLGRLIGRRRPDVLVRGVIPGLRVGDAVIVGIEDGVVMRAALWVYLVPLAGMVLAGAFAQQVLQVHDALVAAFGLVGLAGGFACTHAAGRRAAASPAYRPLLLRRAAARAADCARLARLAD